MRRAARWLAGIVAVLLALAVLSAWLVDTDIGHRWVADRIAGVRTDNGLRFGVGRIDGSLYSRATLREVRVYDPEGLVLAVPEARLDWRPLAWFRNRLDIRSLVIPRAAVVKPLHPAPTSKNGPILPGFDLRIGRLAVERLDLASRVTGVARTGRLLASADVHAGRALVRLDAVVAGSDRLHAIIDAQPDRDRFDVTAQARGDRAGVLARLTGIHRRLALAVGGTGHWSAWHGTAQAEADGVRVVDLALGNRAGAYTLTGVLALDTVTHGKLQSLASPRVLVDGRATFADRRVEGALSLRSPGIATDTTGAVDLAAKAFRDVRVRARLLRASALFPNMTARNFELRAILDGAFATARFDYRLDAERFAFDDTGFENVHAAGQGRFSPTPVLVPIRLTAARVTGLGPEAGGILRDLSAQGVLRVTPSLLSSDALRVRSDKLTGSVGLRFDLDNGHFNIGVNGALGRYLIPGLGVVDVRSQLQVVPGPGGRGARAVGRGEAAMVRLDNAFFQSLAGGLPRMTTGLERTPDTVLHFHSLVLTAPSLRLTGDGFRRRDGTFFFQGSGTQASYGPLTIRLDGQIDHPTLDLVFARPNAALGLAGVRAHLDPNPAGFAFRVDGASRVGSFTGAGEIALPPGGQAAIQLARLDVAGTGATGALAIVPGGFDGRLQLAGAGLGGTLLFRPVGAIQHIEAHLDASVAKQGEVTLRRGHLDAELLLDPAGTRIDATIRGAGLRRGGLSLARFAANARLVDGVGDVRAQISGTRGRAFDVQFLAHVALDRYTVNATGTLDRQPLRLLTPAVIAPEGDGYRLQPTRLGFAGGEAAVQGRFSGQAQALEATLTRLPLAILDIGYPGLGLGGAASGSISYAATTGRAPTGRVAITVRGLSRAGVALASRPIDLGVAGVLAPDRLGVRAMMASGGATIGRAQMLVTPLGTGDLFTRLAQAPMLAQLRYTGLADPLWRLTGVDLFDLSGPVAIAADVGGRLAEPSIRGLVQLNGARLESASTGTVLTDVRASGRFGGSRLTIDRMTADAGRGGRVTGAGQFDLSATRGLGIDLKLQAENAQLINTDAIGASVTGPIAFRSTGRGGTISGDVTLTRSRYRLGQANAASAVPQLRVREINLPGGGEEEELPPTPWRLDLHARAPNNLAVSGLGLSSQWSADLHLTGEPDNPAILGRADLIRGAVDFAGREFQLSRGVIRFAGAQPPDPALDIVADATASDLSATIRVAGVSSKPEISFTSVPALPEDELLSRLLFGTSIPKLSAPEALQLASAVAALQNGRGGLDPINAVRRVARLDRLRILPADPTIGAGTSVAAGKYISRRLYAEIVTDGQGYSATQAEFQVTRWLALLSSISTLGRTSGHVRVSKDY